MLDQIGIILIKLGVGVQNACVQNFSVFAEPHGTIAPAAM